MLNRRAMAISETTIRPMAAFWHPCHRCIRESIHIRRAVEHPRMDLLRVVEQVPWFVYKSAHP
ncbi:hypothetical protein [Shewanella sp. MF08487]|uniref:hypothetical protein n=1 Tax=Shewanella sp. MF08487 TaxID=3434873 RepID=UPI003D7969A8